MIAVLLSVLDFLKGDKGPLNKGSRVKAKFEGTWYKGTTLAKPKAGKVRVRFDDDDERTMRTKDVMVMRRKHLSADDPTYFNPATCVRVNAKGGTKAMPFDGIARNPSHLAFEMRENGKGTYFCKRTNGAGCVVIIINPGKTADDCVYDYADDVTGTYGRSTLIKKARAK